MTPVTMPKRSQNPAKNEPSNKGIVYYALTLKYNPTYKADLLPEKVRYSDEEKRVLSESVFDELRDKRTAKFKEIREEAKGGIHYHACVSFSRVPYFKKLKYQGFHLKWVKVYDLVGWESYIRKELYKSNNIFR